VRVREQLERIARAAAGRSRITLALVVLLAAGGALLALGLKPSTGADTLASRGSSAYKATDAFHREFGDDTVDILVREKVTDLVLTDDLGRLLQLEGCLGGNVPQGRAPYGGANSPCAGIAKLKPTKVVYGPATFLNESVNAVQSAITSDLQNADAAITRAGQEASAAAKRAGLSPAMQAQAVASAQQAARTQQTRDLQQLALSSGLSLTSLPQLDNRGFISQIVFDPKRGADVPKARFAYLFPSRDSALIQVRLRANLTQAQRQRAITLIRAATRMPMFASQRGGTYVVSGVPVVENDLVGSVSGAIVGLLVGAVVAMALALVLVFRARLRLLPLFIALAAAGLTFGAMALAQVHLTMASIAVLPVLIGLAVDYAIQFQSRVEEQRAEGRDGAEAVARAARAGAPTIATAALATAVGFLVLLTSPIPMVRGFGLLLVIGVALAFACTLTAGSAALSLVGRRPGTGAGSGAGATTVGGPQGTVRARLAALGRALARPPRAVGAALAAAFVGAADLVRIVGRSRPLRPLASVASPRAILAASVRRPGAVLLAGLVLAATGWGVESQTKVVSDVTKLVPANLPALRDLTALEQATHSSGEIDVTVSGDDLTDPAVISWMSNYQQKVLRRFGYDANESCTRAMLCPAFSLTDLLGTTNLGSRRAIAQLLDSVPPYFSSTVLTPDRRHATLAFGIRLMPLDEQQHVVDQMRAGLDPPKGVHAALAGLPVLAAQANAQLSSTGRRFLTLALGLAAVGLVLLAVYRRPRRALVPLVPIALATGWSSLVLFATRVPLNPMSATLGALVIAISTEFSVLLSERFRQERAAGHAIPAALARTYRSTGRAVLASGVTAIVGFGVLAFSDIRMLSDFGVVTVVDLTVALVGVLAVLPSVLVLSERVSARSARRARRPAPRPDAAPERAAV